MNPNIPPANFGQAPPQYYQGTNPTLNHPMMLFMGNSQGALWFASVLWFVTWILAIAVLFALLRWLWKKGDKTGR